VGFKVCVLYVLRLLYQIGLYCCCPAPLCRDSTLVPSCGQHGHSPSLQSARHHPQGIASLCLATRHVLQLHTRTPGWCTGVGKL
jgi:hypothetical protein